MPAPTTDQRRLCAAAFLRSVSVGLTGVILVLDLSSYNWSIARAGLLVTLGLAGSATATLLSSLFAERLGRRRTLLLLATLGALGATALVITRSPAALLAAAFFGMINGLGRDRGPAYALEQALLPETTTPERRTLVLAWYGLLLDFGLALGSLLAGIPAILRDHLYWSPAEAFNFAWLFCLLLALLNLALYLGLSPRVELAATASLRSALRISPESRRRIARLAALTGLDSLGGGFLTGALVSYWFFRRFGIDEQGLSLLFFGARMANAASHLVAAWLARRIGLVNTMVFTHIPSSLFLMAVPFAPSAAWATALFLARESLVEMDVPTRQSYILAVVRPEERPFASGMTTLTRNIAYAVAPFFAGLSMTGLALAAPLFLCGTTKIAYDLLLYFSFRRLRPPEESPS